MNVSEHLANLKKSRENARERMLATSQKSMDENRSMNDGEQQEFDAIKAEIQTLDADIKRFSELETMQKEAAVPVQEQAAAAAAKPASEGKTFAVAKNTQKLDKGIAFARVARVRALAKTGLLHGLTDQAEIAKRLYPDDRALLDSIHGKAAVAAASTGSATWAGNLINDGGAAFADFVEFLRPRTLIGQVGDRLRNLPFDTPVLVQGSAGAAKWVKEGDAKPLTKWTYTRTKLAALKVASIAAATKESLMRASIAADTLLRDELARAVGGAIDTTFIDPDAAAVADTSPAGILNGVGATSLTGTTTVAGIRKDLAALMTQFTSNNLPLAGAFWVMPESIAVNLSLVANEVGAAAFPGIGPTGGTLAGLPAFATNYAPVNSSGSVVALVRGDEIFLGDEGGVQVSMSDQASLVMDDSPSGTSVTPTAAQVVSLWQTNSVAFLVERFINWQRRRDASVAWGYAGWTL